MNLFSLTAALVLAVTSDLGMSQPAGGQSGTSPVAVRLPISTGGYVSVHESCGAPVVVLHYDGSRIRWLYEDAAQSHVERPRRVRRQGRVYNLESLESYEVPSNSLVSEMAPTFTRIKVRGRTQISVTVQDDVEMRLCASAALPVRVRRQIR